MPIIRTGIICTDCMQELVVGYTCLIGHKRNCPKFDESKLHKPIEIKNSKWRFWK